MPTIDDENCLLVSDFPKCPRCHGIARPNVLMFGDWCWHEQRTAAQERRLTSESTAGKLIRINPSEPALGGADDAGVETAMAVLADPGSTLCLHMSKLNLYQCLAVARPHYEDIFCLGQHALNDTGRCLAQGAGALDPTDALPPVETAAPTSTSTRGKSKARGRKP